jgi:L-asparagine oxygenase
MLSIIELSKYEINELITLANAVIYNPTNQPDMYCKQLKFLYRCIPERLRHLLMDFKIKGSPTGFLLIRTIPIDDELEPTPLGNNHKIGEKTTLAKIQSILISVMSEMISYEAEGYGRLFQDVVPIKSMENEQTSLGSNKELEIHTEQAFSKLRPDILSLACLRSNPYAKTYTLPVHKIIENMNPEEILMLREPLWNTGVDLSFKLHGKEFIEGDVRGPLSIIHGLEKDPLLLFDQDLMSGITEESHFMIKKIINIYGEHRIAHVLQPGEIIFIDNNRAVHGRSPFSPKYDGKDRFLVRCFGVFDFDKSEHARRGHMVEAIYS